MGRSYAGKAWSRGTNSGRREKVFIKQLSYKHAGSRFGRFSWNTCQVSLIDDDLDSLLNHSQLFRLGKSCNDCCDIVLFRCCLNLSCSRQCRLQYKSDQLLVYLLVREIIFFAWINWVRKRSFSSADPLQVSIRNTGKPAPLSTLKRP